MYLHKRIIQSYQLQVQHLPSAMQLSMQQFEALEAQVAEQRSKGTTRLISLDETMLDERNKTYLQETRLGAEHGNITLAEALSPDKQVFFAKGTHRLLGPVAYVLWDSTNTYKAIRKSVWDALRLTDIGEYDGNFKPTSTFSFNQVDMEELLNQIDENITRSLLHYLRSNSHRLELLTGELDAALQRDVEMMEGVMKNS